MSASLALSLQTQIVCLATSIVFIHPVHWSKHQKAKRRAMGSENFLPQSRTPTPLLLVLHRAVVPYLWDFW